VNDLADIFDAAADALDSVMGVMITYTTADNVVVGPICATVGKTEHMIDNGSGAGIDYQSRDYLVRTSDLVDSGGAPIEPQSGDKITEIDTGITHLVKLPAADAPVWRWADVARVRRRIHSKQAGVAS
jgi:hypothetical protein